MFANKLVNPFELELSGSNIAQEQNDGRNDQSRFRVELFGEVGHKVSENFDGSSRFSILEPPPFPASCSSPASSSAELSSKNVSYSFE